MLFLVLACYVPATCGVPVEVDYSLPPDYFMEELTGTPQYSVIASEGGVFTIVPLVLRDTLSLPALPAWHPEKDSLLLDAPLVIVTPGFPDSLMTPATPSYPLHIDIPPGLPEDYARNMSFWLVWGRSPGFPWLYAAIGLLVLAAAAWFIMRRRRSTPGQQEETPEPIPRGKAAEAEALALLDCQNMVHGRWALLYGEIERQLRVTAAGKFGVFNRALTLNQLARTLASSAEGRKFMEQASPLLEEIILQVYASWGSTREKAAASVRKLASLRREWGA